VSLVDALANVEVIELGHVLGKGMPQLRAHPTFVHALLERHGEHPSALEGISHANDLVTMGLHTGTHMDALGHISRRGELHGGRPAAHLEEGSGPLAEHSGDQLAPYVVEGVLFDIPRVRGVEALEPGEAVTPEDLEAALEGRALPTSGWAGLVRTGWDHHWTRGGIYSGRRGGMPGVQLPGAQWLAGRGAVVVGSDTAGFEAFPAEDWYVHAFLLVDEGIPIMENLELRALAERRPERFVFVGLPLRVRGSTAGPLRPVALVDR
jgi:kynurenine formamidase